ncbi:conserved hypothetical protein [Agrobacterium sp. NCPPB 925]|nr:conserved hypothetical protein [Agrobacterium sp. NCPPB 925]
MHKKAGISHPKCQYESGRLMRHFLFFGRHFWKKEMARVTGLEPATSGVTGRHSNRLSYTRAPQTCVCVFSEEQDGASDGARTRDLRRDRPAL